MLKNDSNLTSASLILIFQYGQNWFSVRGVVIEKNTDTNSTDHDQTA